MRPFYILMTKKHINLCNQVTYSPLYSFTTPTQVQHWSHFYPYSLAFPECHINRIFQYVIFCVHVPFSIIHAIVMLVSACITNLTLFIVKEYFIEWTTIVDTFTSWEDFELLLIFDNCISGSYEHLSINSLWWNVFVPLE